MTCIKGKDIEETPSLIKKIDLHVHTNRSDGTFSPEEVVDYAHSIGLQAVAITDHDAVSGITPAIDHAKQYGIEIIPGIEMSAEWAEQNKELEIHMLGYFIDYKNDVFLKELHGLAGRRYKRVESMLEKLKDSGINLDIEDVEDFAPSADVLGRLHVAQAMVKEGYVSSINRAFDQYIGNNKSCYVPKQQLNPEGAVEAIKKVNGLAVIAHPGLLDAAFAESLIERLAKTGLDGIEAYYPEHSPETVRRFEDLAAKNNLILTGGTDCHGLARGRIIMGTLPIPYTLVEKMKARKNNKNS